MHLYGLPRVHVDHILETFPIVKRNDVKRHGSHRTKLTILRLYDETQVAMEGGAPYRSELDAPLGEPPVS